jgi:CubicO group peptidase (beta-lactamase class C family)
MKLGCFSAAAVVAVWVLAAGWLTASERSDGESPTTSERPAPQTSGTAAPGSAAHQLSATDVEAWLNGLLTYGLKNGDIAGAVVAIVKDGEVLFQSGYGYADVEKKISMDAQRIMTRIGSTSKLFTWTAVMQLVQQGKLDLRRNVDDYLDFKVSPAGGKPITLLDLMNHRGGFEEGLKDVLAFDPHRLQSTETYLEQHPRPLLFAPGTVPAYSNYGTALAGYIVQRVSGEPYERYIEEHIFLPLGMRHSTFVEPLPERFKGMVAQGYRTASGPPQPFELIVVRPAGSATTTAADMARFMLAHLQDGHLGDYDMLSDQTARLMHSPSETALPGFGTMAHGFFYEVRNGRTLIGHGGDTIFFHTELELLPREGVGIFYSFNSRGREEAVYGLRKALLDQFMDRYFPPTVTSPEPATLGSAVNDARKIAGRYESSRRVQHGFLSVFYLLQQTVISANQDGTIVAPNAFEPGEAHFHEVAPDIWRQFGGTRQLALRHIGGVDTVMDSEDPTSVFQRVPGQRATPLNLTVLLVSFVTLAVAIVLWPIGYMVRRHYQRPFAHSPEFRRGWLLLRVAAAFGVLWLVSWTFVLLPVLSVQLDVYSSGLDPVIRTLQIAGAIVIALATAGCWSLWRLWRLKASWAHRIGNALIAAALLGLVWIGCIGGLISFNLNY